MFLKRMQLHGFKSFADKTELEFVQGITAVVGPNGSGKSNISDSIRWVLGEQSARSLRGGNMQDIIFSGSDSRKAVNVCEVTLTLDNSDNQLPLDFTEVSVTRRLHRSGESEYFINKQACRLRDITELFMDTGIGKEAYSIIGQGRIEEILSTRSEDRRGIFEEASGIVKYKTRKKEAEKKLEETDQNLLRIHDLIVELEDQIEPLRAQSEKAKRYKSLNEELTKLDISLYVHKIEQLHRVWTETNETLEQLQEQQLTLSTEVQKQDAMLEKDRMAARALEIEIEQLQAELLHWSEEAEKAEGQSSVLKERLQSLQRQVADKQVQMNQLQERIDKLEVERSAVIEKQSVVASKIAELEAERKTREARLSEVTALTNGQVAEEMKSELLETLNRLAQLRNEIRYAEQQMETVERQQLKLNEESVQWEQKNVRLTKDLQQTEAQVNELEDEIESIRKQYVETGEALKQKQNLLDEVMLTVRKWQQKLDALTSRRDTLKELQDDFDGFFHGVKEVLKFGLKKNVLKGVHGAIAELIRVPAHLETAIEIALGNAMQHIVMEDEVTSREAIAFLKNRQLGRATFLPLNVIKGRSIPAQDVKTMMEQPGVVGIASELIDCDEQYREVISNLLGTVILADNLKQANAIAAACKYRYRVVTLDGDVVNAGGSMTGGSLKKKTSSLLSRQRRVEELEQEIAEATEQVAKLTENTEQLKREHVTIGENLDSKRRLGEQKRLEEQQLRSRMEQFAREIENVKQQMALFSAEQKELESEMARYEEQKKTYEYELTELAKEQEQLEQAIDQADRDRKLYETEREALQNELTDLRVRHASLAQENQSLTAEQERISREIEEALTLKATYEEELDHIYEAIAQNEAAQVEQTKRLNEARINREQCAETIDFKRADRTERHQTLEREESETKDQRDELKQLEQKLHQIEVKANRLDVELDNVLNKLAEEYELSYELAKQHYPKPENVEAAQQQVSSLRRQISMLGEVNLGAIEEFERVHDRYQFLSTQKDDLVEAKQTLLEVIKEVESEMSTRFKQTFSEIRSRFGSVFSRLFGGGRADLVLTDPDNLLETGIDIVAQPPGKKLQNLQLLSGGERALTAIALLFAILHIKPVPFCVLDEVEAALDEANVARFAQYLREFSGETQFIVVTHRKGTMEEADVLYGVAMEDDGVSKLVSVKLEDGEPVSA